MATVNYITPITDRTQIDVRYAQLHQNDLVNKNKGAWNYTDLNRICNNLKYAAEYMYDQGFLSQPYQMQIKLDWKETDIITYEQLNTMIVNNMNNLKTYSRPDLEWYYIASIANMNYSVANWLEKNIHALATQLPLPADTYELTVTNGSGSGEYEANTIVTIQANTPDEGMIFSHWSGDHLENIGNPESAITTYKMPHQDINLMANYTSAVTHTLTVVTNSGTETTNLYMGSIHYIEADPAPQGKVFHHWEISPDTYEGNLYEPAATTHFTMPNEDVTLTAVYITKGQKHLVVNNGIGSGWYDYDTYVSVSSNKPANATFTSWSGDVQYLTGNTTDEYNSIRIPDVSTITITANWTTPSVPLVQNVELNVVNGTISSTGDISGTFTQNDRVTIAADPAPTGYTFNGWNKTGGGSISGANATTATIIIGTTATTVVATYRELEYHDLIVVTNSGTTVTTKEKYDYFSVHADPAPTGYTFYQWTGDTDSFNGHIFDINRASTGTCMGSTDRTITAVYRTIEAHTLTVKQLSGDVTYTQNEFSTMRITAESAPIGKRFTHWSLSGNGSLSTTLGQSTTYTFGNGDAVLTPNYVNVWTVTVIGGTINGSTSATLDEGGSYRLLSDSLAAYERFDGWTKIGPGTINNLASTSTSFTVGNGDATITANVSEYSNKTLTIYARNPDTGTDTLVSSQTYAHGTSIDTIEAPVAPNRTTFSSWLGDTSSLYPSALASTVSIRSLTTDTTITATYYYPEAPEYYDLTVYNGYPESGSYAAGTQITIRANTPSQNWEFYKWYGDTQYLVDPDLTLSENAVIMPLQSITLYAKYKAIGELPLYRVSVSNGIASATYTDSQSVVHNESGVYIDIPAGIQVTLTADPDVVGWTFDYWSGNFQNAGVVDITPTDNPATFTMVEQDLNIVMVRRELDKYTVYPTNATGPGTVYPGTYPIAGNLVDTENQHYTFEHWLCVDANDTDCISAIAQSSNIETTITLTDKDLWITAVYTTHYKLTVIDGQDSGDHYYYENEVVNTVYANTAPTGMQFDHWDDPVGIITNIYDPTPTITMKDSVATITAVYTSLTATGNSVVVTGDDLHTGIIRRSRTSLINGIFAVGTIVLDRDGCIGVITQVDPDSDDDTDDYRTQKLFYGGNF